MNRDAVIESWLASMSKSELIDQCFFYQGMALKHGRMYNALKDENAKLRELCAGLWNVMWACAEQRCPHRHEDCFVVNGNGDGPKGHGECWYKLCMCELGIGEMG